MEHQKIALSSNWTFKQASDPKSTFLPVSQFPTVIHLDLIHHGIIPDPFVDTNYTQCQWVGEEEWLYQTKFSTPPQSSSSTRYELTFEGLDTHATIILNGKEIKKTDNMYLQYLVDVTDDIKTESENELQILFHSTFLIGRQLEKEAPEKPLFWHNGDRSRLQVRKAPYSYGWDFTQPFLTSGPWRPIYLEVYEAKIQEMTVVGSVSEDLTTANVHVQVRTQGTKVEKVKIQIYDHAERRLHAIEIPVLDGVATTDFDIFEPALWWPNGNGSQPLHRVTVNGVASDKTICTATKRIGLRRLRLIKRPLKEQPGETFFFEVNNVPIFARGANWTPTDMFLPRITPERYRSWVELAARGNQNMIRVWGGGIYEDQVFYDYCDELGIMIWHDFMLACGAYPATPQFLKTIEEETISNIAALRHHPSIVLWCGNNEDHMFADRYNAQYDYDDLNPDNWLKTNWPARIIYDNLLPELVQQHSPEIPYHPGSPWGGKPAMDPLVGDVHAWGVWMKASEQYPYQWYYKLTGRFVSEFGLKSYPSLKSIAQYVSDPKEHYPQSRTLDAHLKASSKSPWAKDYRTVALYIQENFRLNTLSLANWVYGSQLSQAEAMTYAYTGWRRQWKGPGFEECAGALVWVLNDAFPSVSWSLADFWIRPKYAYYSIKRACAPVVVGATRVEIEKSRPSEDTEAYVVREERVQVWGSNLTVKPVEGKLVVNRIDAYTGKTVSEKSLDVVLDPNRSTELLDEAIDDVDSRTTLVFARLLDHQDEGKVIARFLDWPQPLKYLHDLPKDVGIKLDVSGDDITVSSNLPVKGLVFEVDDEKDEIFFEDNCIDLAPGDTQIVHAQRLNGREVKWTHLALAAD